MPATDDQIVKKARPFFLNFFNRLANDLNTLTSAPVTCNLTDVAVYRGWDDLEQVFETDRTCALVREDGLKSGDIHIVLDVATSIALAGLMMMFPEAQIKEGVKTRDYNEEVQEGFQEIANQVVGAMNDLVEKKLEGGHLFLDLPTTYHQYGECPDSLDKRITFIAGVVDIQVSNFPVAPSVWLLSRGFCETFFKLEIEPTEGDLEEASERGADAGGGGAAVGVDDAGGAGGGDAAGADAGGADGAGGDAAFGADGKAGGAAAGADIGAGGAGGAAVGADIGAGGAGGGSGADAGGGAGVGGDDWADGELLPGGDDDDLDPGGLLAVGGRDEDDLGADDGAPAGGGPRNVRDALPPGVPVTYGEGDGLPHPEEPGSIKVVTTEMPFTLREEDPVIKAINAMRHDGFRQIGIDRQGKLIRIVTQSDLRQLMGPFFGTQAMSARDKAICTLPLGKINESQQLIAILNTGTVNEATDLVLDHNLRVLPVISKQGVLRGFIPALALLTYYRRKKQG